MLSRIKRVPRLGLTACPGIDNAVRTACASCIEWATSGTTAHNIAGYDFPMHRDIANSNGIQRADIGLRRIAAIVLGLASLAAIALVLGFQSFLSSHAATLTTDDFIVRMRAWLAVVVSMIGVCILLLGGYAARSARGIMAQRRWPLAGARVLRDTPIRHGDDALRFARWLNGIAAVLVVVALLVGVIAWRLFSLAR